ncbi:MAG: alanine--glyoxylate aminotransferase family protein, partial [Deltaproteobacteria bacterium]|nr:alanine--glyoxylate aminotransferase family protein [Deltaproteobacteria bacterium]
LADIERKLRERPGITTIAMVFHETSTSVINPVSQVGNLADRYGKAYIVDGVSAVGGEDINVVRDHIDFCTCSSNKCLASLPGVGVICARKSKLEATKANSTRVAYLNLHRLYKMSATNGVPRSFGTVPGN